ncbi:MAG: carbohydrate-binding domain-containing protein [Prevotella sp.]|jgi:hypothetical protein
MKNLNMILTAAALCSSLAAGAQTLNVVVGEVTYQIPAEQAGDMIYSDGTSLTILNKTFTLSDITKMYIDGTEVTDNTVSIDWDGSSADVKVAGNAMQYLTVTASGADVSIVQSEDLADEITYTLSGSSTDGSFYMDGELKATVVLNGLSLTNQDDYAINIENGKRIAIELADGTDNYLADGTTSTSGDCKAALMVNGHTEFDGSGTLTLTGNYKHAFWGDEYVKVKSGTGTITVAGAVKDGFNINQYFQQNDGDIIIDNVGDDGIQVGKDDDDDTENNGMILLYGGTQNINITATAAKGLNAEGDIIVGESTDDEGGSYTITTSGDGEYDSDEADTKACAAMKSDANMTINAGTLTLSSSGTGGKGINVDSTLVINGGTINITTTGTQYVYGSLDSSPKGIKAEGDITINGGTISVTCTGGEGSEGIESKSEMTINGGTITGYTYDDAINCTSNLYIKGGTITVVTTNNDGIDANANIYISGGTLAAYGGSAPECGIDAAEGYGIYITGGTVLGVGGTSSTPSSTTGSQAYVNVSSSVTANSTITISDGSTTLASFTVPSTYSSNTGGGWNAPGGGPGGGGNPGGQGGTYIMISTPDMVSGTSYTVTSGSSSTTGTATTEGSGGWF